MKETFKYLYSKLFEEEERQYFGQANVHSASPWCMRPIIHSLLVLLFGVAQVLAQVRAIALTLKIGLQLFLKTRFLE